MEKKNIKQQIRDVATKMCAALNALQYIVDENGKDLQAEYYALCNAIISLESAYEDIKDI